MDDSGEARIPRCYVAELSCFFAAHDRWLFGHACVRTHGDRELAADLVQDTFEAAARAWATLRDKEAFRRRHADIHARYQATAADTAAQALNAIALERARQIIDDMPPRQKEISLMRWQNHMKTAEIAAVLGVAEGTVHAHLHTARAKLITGLERYYPFGKDSGEGTAS